jgi:4'-phosphopantetheinyl transferase EntD
MIERILPPGPAVAAELFADETVDLFPAEQEVIAKAVDKRRREFTSVRACARRALAQLGQPPAPLIPGERGAPGWPDGITGSMTHCDGYRAAVLARTTDLTSIGLDAEPNLPLPNGVERTIALPAERDHVAGLASSQPGVCWDRLLFCAKEAVYKAWFPVTGKWLGFEQAEITFSAGGPATGHRATDNPATDGTFAARILIPGPIEGFSGRWLCAGRHILTLILNELPPGTGSA